jgi:RNA polymerase sigma-70 factor (ECF subfamily)
MIRRFPESRAYASDRQLARRLLAGDRDAFDEFFETYFPGLYRFALVRTDHDADAAEEIAQATLCKAISKLGTYRGEAMLFTWLCTFCRHEISAHFRRFRGQPRPLHLEEDNPEIAAALDTLSLLAADGPEQALQRTEVSRLVQTTLDRLPRRYGDALEWKYAEGLSVKDIAARLGLSPKAAESLLTRARQAFRDGFTTLTRSRAPEVET